MKVHFRETYPSSKLPSTTSKDISKFAIPGERFQLQSEESEGEGTPAFQFSPDFHRVPSPVIQPEHTFIPSLDNSKEQEKSKILSRPSFDLVIPPVETVVQSADHEVTLALPAPTTISSALAASPKDIRKVSAKIEEEPASDLKNNTVSARAKFFEMEIAQLQQPQPKPRKFYML